MHRNTRSRDPGSLLMRMALHSGVATTRPDASIVTAGSRGNSSSVPPSTSNSRRSSPDRCVRPATLPVPELTFAQSITRRRMAATCPSIELTKGAYRCTGSLSPSPHTRRMGLDVFLGGLEEFLVFHVPHGRFGRPLCPKGDVCNDLANSPVRME